MTETLKFEKIGDVYEAKFTSVGGCVVEIERDDDGPVSVLANIDGMRPIPVSTFSNPYMEDLIFGIEVATGVEITIRSKTEVTNAKMLTND